MEGEGYEAGGDWRGSEGGDKKRGRRSRVEQKNETMMKRRGGEGREEGERD